MGDKYILLLCIVCWTGLTLLLVCLPLRLRRLDRRTGICLLLLQRHKNRAAAAVWAVCYLLPLAMLVHPLNILYGTAFCCAALIGCEVECRDYIAGVRGGIYKNGLCAGGRFILFQEVQAVPVLRQEDWNDVLLRDKTLAVLTGGRTVTLRFSTAEECMAAAELFRTYVPAAII